MIVGLELTVAFIPAPRH